MNNIDLSHEVIYRIYELKSIYRLYSILERSKRKTMQKYPEFINIDIFGLFNVEPCYEVAEVLQMIECNCPYMILYRHLPASKYITNAINPIYHIFTFDQLFGESDANPHRYPDITNNHIRAEMKKLNMKSNTKFHIMPYNTDNIPKLDVTQCKLKLYTSNKISKKYKLDLLHNLIDELINSIRCRPDIAGIYNVGIKSYDRIKYMEITVSV